MTLVLGNRHLILSRITHRPEPAPVGVPDPGLAAEKKLVQLEARRQAELDRAVWVANSALIGVR